jgi:tetratricopeptide (TPR) repeat protein
VDRTLEDYGHKAKALLAAGDYIGAIRCVDAAAKDGCASPDLFVLKARALQLSDEPGPMAEIAACFDSALKLDPRNIQALLEYGWFELNVMDQAAFAEERFRQCLALLRQENTEATLGLLKCLEERGPLSIDSELSAVSAGLVDKAELRRALSGTAAADVGTNGHPNQRSGGGSP